MQVVRKAAPGSRHWLAILVLGLVAGLGTTDVHASGAAARADREQNEKQKLEEVRRKIGELKTSIEGARDQQSQLRDELRATEVSIGEISRTLRRLANEQKAKTEELRGLRARRAEAEAARCSNSRSSPPI